MFHEGGQQTVVLPCTQLVAPPLGETLSSDALDTHLGYLGY